MDRDPYMVPATQPPGLSAPEVGRMLAGHMILIRCDRHGCTMCALIPIPHAANTERAWRAAHDTEAVRR